MDTTKLGELLAVLREHHVTYYKSADLELGIEYQEELVEDEELPDNRPIGFSEPRATRLPPDVEQALGKLGAQYLDPSLFETK